MPNSSHNSCTVTGPETDIKAMFDLMVVIDWVANNWGTPWNASNFSSNYDGGPSATFEFNTAWEFPKPIAEGLSEEFPSLRFVWKVFNESLIEDPEYRGDDCEYHGGRLVSANWYERPFA